MRKSESQTQGFDFGTSPHGLPADLQRTNQETRGSGGLHSLEDGVCRSRLAGAVAPAAAGQPAAQDDIPESYRGLLGRLWVAVMPAAAWWYENVINNAAASSYDPIWHTVDRFAPGRGQQVAGFLAVSVIPKLLGEWPVWPIARSYLYAKWELEDERRAAGRSA
jgi:hypothetical protein